MKAFYLLLPMSLFPFITWSQPQVNFSYDQAGNRIQREFPVSDLTPTIILFASNFTPSASQNFLMNIFEAAGYNTSQGNVKITVNAPTGYTVSFNNSISSIFITGPGNVSVSNTKWSVISNIANQQLQLQINAGEYIPSLTTISLGFTITRTTANSGSTSNITVNVNDDPGMTYDNNSLNNVYSRIISAL